MQQGHPAPQQPAATETEDSDTEVQPQAPNQSSTNTNPLTSFLNAGVEALRKALE
jgi:hypothetical protein